MQSELTRRWFSLVDLRSKGRKSNSVIRTITGLMLITALFFAKNTSAKAPAFQGLVINDLRLTTIFNEYINNDFFFHVSANLTIQEWMDASRFNRTAIINGPLFEIDSSGSALSFDGSDDSAVVQDVINPGPENGMTIEIWARFSGSHKDIAGRDWYTLLCEGDRWDKAPYCLLFAPGSPDGTLLFVINGMRIVSADVAIANNVWYQIVATFNGSLASLFLDGAPVASSPFLGVLREDHYDLNIGWEKADIYPLNGSVKSLSILSKALNASEVSLLYQGESPVSSDYVTLDLNFGYMKYSFQRSENEYNFREVFRADLTHTTFSWSESKAGKYIYRVAMPCPGRYSEPTYYSNLCVVYVIQRQQDDSVNNIAIVVLLVATAAVCLYFSEKQQT